MKTTLEYLAAYALAVIFAPTLGFTAVLDLGYLFAGQLLWFLLWVFVLGPACLFGVVYLTS